MAKCTVCLDYDSKLNRVNPCENDGWPELDDLCPDHFREYRIEVARNEAYKAEGVFIELQHRLYLVEVAMGLRSAPYAVGPVSTKDCPSTVEGTRAATPREQHVTNESSSPLSRRVRPSFASQIEEDFKEEME